MNESIFDQIQLYAKSLDIDSYSSQLAEFSQNENFSSEQLEAVQKVFSYLSGRKNDSIISTLLNHSRLPQKEPKTFENFDFERIKGKQVEALKSLTTMAPLYAKKNLAFIGPQGVGKTHLAMAFGRECCNRRMKAYFLKATELNHKLLEAIKSGREESVVNGLVKPSCLIIDEIGRCVFSKEATRLFFDVVDRRYNKEGPNTMIITSNTMPSKWGEYFNEDDALLCALDRIFDDANVFVINGESYRGRKLITISLEAGGHTIPRQKSE